MGSLDSEQDRGDDETQHRVTLTKAFWLGRTTVTQAQWRAVMESNPSHIKGEDLPVECVSWDDATEFCGKLNGEGLISSGWKFALPTEAQWEFACRAGTTGPYGGDLDKMSWYFGNSGGMTRPVETKIPNAWGLYDLHGNVAQWCADWYEEYPAGSVTDPTGPSTGSYRVFRGGSGILVGGDERSAYRIRSEPGSPNNGMGFRVAAVPAERGQAGAVAGIAATGTGARDERVAKSAAPVKVSLEGARVGTERTIVLSGTVKLSLCAIPAGTFTMGSPASEANRSNNETQHRVTLTKAFWLGRTDVTQAQWRAVMGNSPSYFKGDNLPVEQVSWNDSKESVVS